MNLTYILQRAWGEARSRFQKDLCDTEKGV